MNTSELREILSINCVMLYQKVINLTKWIFARKKWYRLITTSCHSQSFKHKRFEIIMINYHTRSSQQVRNFLTCPLFSMKTNTAPVNNHQSIDDRLVLSKLHGVVCRSTYSKFGTCYIENNIDVSSAIVRIFFRKKVWERNWSWKSQ